MRAFASLAERVQRADGHPAFNEQTLLDLGSRVLKTVDREGVAIAAVAIGTTPDGVEAELAVDPDHRRQGIGTEVVEQLLAEAPGPLVVWAHGNHPGAVALAERFGFRPVRSLLQLRAGVPAEASPWQRDDLALSAFRPGIDDEGWVALNSRAFAGHPEQGRLTVDDLRQRLGEPWFDPGDLLIARDRAGRMAGYCWLKVVAGLGEVYAIGVDPDHAGRGIGRALLQAGLDRLRARGVRTVLLYVEADNAPALTLYRSMGFADHAVDIRYRHDTGMG